MRPNAVYFKENTPSTRQNPNPLCETSPEVGAFCRAGHQASFSASPDKPYLPKRQKAA
jgi:hypothetical protein